MAKLFIQDVPKREELDAFLTGNLGINDTWPHYNNFLFMKVASELENHLDSILAPHNLSSGRFTLLLLLNGMNEGMMPSEMSQKVGVTQATISGLLNGLEKAELIRRETHQKDGRSYVIKITDKGNGLIKELLPVWAPKMEAFWNRVGQEQRENLSAILEKMVADTSVLSKA